MLYFITTCSKEIFTLLSTTIVFTPAVIFGIRGVSMNWAKAIYYE